MSGQAEVPAAWKRKGFRFSVIAGVFVLAAGLSFGAGRLAGLGNIPVHSAIPAPLKGDDIFVEGQDPIAQDSVANTLDTTGQGIVHLKAAGAPAGIGLVLTESGKVLTTYQPGAGTAKLTAEYVFSRKTFPATVIATDPKVHLALLQLKGGQGRPFSTVTVGNSDNIVSSASVIRESSQHQQGQILDSAVSTSPAQHGVSFDVGQLTKLGTKVDLGRLTWRGLLASAMTQAVPPVIGGPLVNPNGHVIGITIGSREEGADVVSYAIPINGALAAADRMAGGS